MVKEKKEDRLSFRITPEVSDKIDDEVRKWQNVKDRSQFGSKAVSAYLNYLEVENKLILSLSHALFKIAEKTEMDDIEELNLLKELLEAEAN